MEKSDCRYRDWARKGVIGIHLTEALSMAMNQGLMQQAHFISSVSADGFAAATEGGNPAVVNVEGLPNSGEYHAVLVRSFNGTNFTIEDRLLGLQYTESAAHFVGRFGPKGGQAIINVSQ